MAAIMLEAFQYSNFFLVVFSLSLRESKSLFTSATIMSRIVSSGQPMERRFAMYLR